MNAYLTYGIIFVILLALELCYFKVADHFNIIDKPNERSSHSTIVLRGGGIIFLISVWIWGAFFGFQYPWFLVGLTLVASISFVDDIHSLPDSVRLVAQFAAAAMAFYQLGILHWSMWWIILLALIVYVGATNVINFMDGINGITAGYSLAVLIPLALVNINGVFVEQSLIISTVLASLVFCIFNFRPKGKAKCFAGDVGSIGIAFIILFLLGNVMIKTTDITWLIFLLVYGVDGCLTIVHRIMLHENLGEAHRKHAYQIMANELKVGHVKVALLYTVMQLVIFFCRMRRYKSHFDWFDRKELRSMLQIAIPSILQQSTVSIGMMIVQAVVNPFGTQALAGYAATMRVENVFSLIFVSIGNAVSPYVSQNLGAKKIGRIKKGYHAALVLDICFAVLAFIVIETLHTHISSLFLGKDGTALAYQVSGDYMKWLGYFFIFMGIKMATDGVLRGLGIMRPFLIANMVNLAIRLSVALICAPRFGIEFVWLAVPAGWFANFLISYVALRKSWPVEKVD